jgi:hypothetical protein
LYFGAGKNIGLFIIKGGLHQATQNILTLEEDGVSVGNRKFIE